MSATTPRKRRISSGVRLSICTDYADGDAQKAIAERYELSQVRVSQILREEGVKTRTNAEVNPVTFDVALAENLYIDGLSGAAIGRELGVSSGTVLTHMRRAGITRLPGGVRLYTGYDEGFFATVDPLRSYWAGFLAADGCLYENRVMVGLHPQDRGALEALKRAANLPQPIYTRDNGTGREYVYLEICCKQWVEDLTRNYGLHPHKAFTLRPPKLPTSEDEWAFTRGYFDGDGHADRNGASIQITSGSKYLLEWMIRDVFKVPHAVYDHNGSWGCRVTGDACRRVVPQLYSGSTPDTRMARKYDRLVTNTSSERA